MPGAPSSVLAPCHPGPRFRGPVHEPQSFQSCHQRLKGGHNGTFEVTDAKPLTAAKLAKDSWGGNDCDCDQKLWAHPCPLPSASNSAFKASSDFILRQVPKIVAQHTSVAGAVPGVRIASGFQVFHVL